MSSPHTNSHDALVGVVQEAVSLAVGGAHQVAALPPEAQVAGAVGAVAGVIAARRKAGEPKGAFSMLVQDRFHQFTQSH